jgi:hypothetical protein
VNRKDLIEKAVRDLMEDLLKGPEGLFARGETLRLVGVSASGLDDSPFEQMSLFDLMEEETGERSPSAAPARPSSQASPSPLPPEASGSRPDPSAPSLASPSPEEKRKKKLEDMMKKIRGRYGEDALRRGAR